MRHVKKVVEWHIKNNYYGKLYGFVGTINIMGKEVIVRGKYEKFEFDSPNLVNAGDCIITKLDLRRKSGGKIESAIWHFSTAPKGSYWEGDLADVLANVSCFIS